MKDQSFVALIDKKNLPKMYKYAERVRNDELSTEEFYQCCENRYNDHHNQFDFLEVSKADDLCLDQGIVQYINLAIGASPTRFEYIGKGTGTTTPVAGNTALVAEVLPRVDAWSFGWTKAAGATIRFAGIFGESLPTITVNESGVFATPNAGAAILCRNVYTNDAITHTVNYSGFIIASIVELVPKMT